MQPEGELWGIGMSLAGVVSNRGDVYQTLVAMDFALMMLFDPSYEWMEVDSLNYPVDDVVLGREDGSLDCCQCKKNQTDFGSWTLSDLDDELNKAAKLLSMLALDVQGIDQWLIAAERP